MTESKSAVLPFHHARISAATVAGVSFEQMQLFKVGSNLIWRLFLGTPSNGSKYFPQKSAQKIEITKEFVGKLVEIRRKKSWYRTPQTRKTYHFCRNIGHKILKKERKYVIFLEKIVNIGCNLI